MRHRNPYLPVKRFLDVVASLVALVVLSPLLLLIGIAVRISSPGPALFGQERLGLHGKLFRMWKFRTMVVNAPDIRNPDGSTFNALDDPRVTPIGRMLRAGSLDELPQLWNILKGEMSLVGGRPDLKDALTTYEGSDGDRLLARPGLTSYAIVHGRNNVPVKRRRELDAWYARNVRFMVDLKVLARTVLIVLRRDNVINELSKGTASKSRAPRDADSTRSA